MGAVATTLLYLYFRNADGSLALGGWWVVFVAVIGVGGQSILLLVRPDLYMRLFARGGGAWFRRIPTLVLRVWAAVCLVVAGAAVIWVLNTTPGKLY
jgi:hypothetical protein